MYIIANPTNREIVISDLKLSLSPRQSRDLHEAKLPIPPEKSKDLEFCKKKGLIKVLRQDSDNKISSPTQVLPQKEVIIKEKEVIKNVVNTDDIKNIIQQEIQKVVEKINTQSVKNDQNDILQQILSKMNEISKPISNQNDVYIEGQIDEETLQKIHVKTLNKITQNVSGNVECNDDKINDTVSKNISELEGLL